MSSYRGFRSLSDWLDILSSDANNPEKKKIKTPSPTKRTMVDLELGEDWMNVVPQPIKEPAPQEQIEEIGEEKTLEAVVAESIGGLSPLLLSLGVGLGFFLFVIISMSIIGVILFGQSRFSPLPSDPIIVDFDSGTGEYWAEQNEGSSLSASGKQAIFEAGGYRLTNRDSGEIFWSSAGLNLGFGTYEVDITIKEDVGESGAGLAMLLDDNSFYLIELDPDGFIWIGRCENGCMQAEPLTGGGWFAVDALQSGLGETNQLKVTLKQDEMIVDINDIEIGYVANQGIGGRGDVAFVVEAGSGGEISALFDNFSWTPLP